MSASDHLQIYRKFDTGRRCACAWYDCKLESNGWRVHYHADWAPSEDWECVREDDLLAPIDAHIKEWQKFLRETHPTLFV